MSDYEALVIVSLNQPAYKNYISYLPAYMKAMATQERQSVIKSFHPLDYPATSPLVQSGLPSVAISFSNVPDAALLDRIRSEGGMELSVRGQKIFLIASPNGDLLRAVANAGAIRNTAAPTGSANLESLSTLSLIRRIFSAFLRTHVYPAFNDVDHLEYNEKNWVVTSVDKRTADTTLTRGKKRTRAEDGSSAMEDISEPIEEVDTSSTIPPGNKIIYAIPGSKTTHGWGEASELPTGDGLFVRYVEQLQNTDREKIVPRIINQYFLGTLGEHTDAVRTLFGKIRSDWGVLCHTPEGKVLSHIAKCIDVGIRAQARIFPVIDSGEYIGSALLGAGFQISAYDKVWTPVSAIALQNSITAAGSHVVHLKAIADIIGGMDEEVYDNVMKTTTMVQLREVLLEASMTDEERDKIATIALKLKFNQKSLNVSVPNLVKVFNLIANPAEDLPVDFPIHPTKLFEKARFPLVWSAFGANAPTCNFAGGKTIDLQNPGKLDRHIAFRIIPLHEAIIDMEVVLSKKQFFSTSLNRRSGPFKDRMYKAGDFDQIFVAMKGACGVSNVTVGSSTSGGSSSVLATALIDDGF